MEFFKHLGKNGLKLLLVVLNNIKGWSKCLKKLNSNNIMFFKCRTNSFLCTLMYSKCTLVYIK